MPAFLARFERSITLAAGVAQDVDLPIDGARSWCVVVKNTGPTNAVTAATLSRSPLGVLFGPATALRLTTGVTTYDLTLTDTSGAWADSDVATGRIKTDGTGYLDTLEWLGKTTAGTLDISAITVWDYPD